jgi:hexosaminidase
VENITWKIPFVSIRDYPRFHYRGMMLDVARQFFDVSTVEQYLDWLSMHKINRFHWHLADDEGWRIEILKYPKLTSVGAWRGPNEALPPSYGSGDKRYGGYYTQKQIKEVVRYAATLHIEIIPEIDLPGHSRAAGAAYPEILCLADTMIKSQPAQGDAKNVWCVGNENNFSMLKDILKEVAALFPSKTIHIGGDEVDMSIWQSCPRCLALMKKQNMSKPEELQNYFVRRLEGIIHGLGKQMAGWDEIIEGGDLDPTTSIYAWRSLQRGVASTSKGLPTIIMVGQHYYFDMAQSKYERGHNWAGLVPLEKVYSFDPADQKYFSSEQLRLIQGVQGGIWSELLNEPARFFEYQSYPRICALAEAGWTPQAERNWDDFYTRLTNSHFERMYYMGIAFRVPPPVVLYKNGTVTARLPYSNAEVRYTNDGSEPDSLSALYQAPIKEFDFTKLRFKTFYKQLSSVAIPPECDVAGTWKISGKAKPVEQEWNISPVFDRAGIWYANFEQEGNEKGVVSVSHVKLCENGVVVASDERLTTITDRPVRYRLPALAYDKTKTYKLKATLQSETEGLSGNVKMERSPYLEPVTGVSVDMNLKGESAQVLTDYNFDTYVRTADQGKTGQSITFAFESPVICSLITSVTGFPFTGIYPLKTGHLEISYDGSTFIRSVAYANGTAAIQPLKPVQTVRIVVDGPNDDPQIIIQDLRIE